MQPAKPSEATHNLLLILFILLCLAAGYFLAQKYLSPGEAIEAPVDTSCDLRSAACSVEFENGGQVTFSMSPKNIPLLKPIQLEVSVTQLQPHKVAVDIIGLSMDMGYNRPPLQLDDDGVFRGQAILPICSSSTMYWEARVLLHTEHGLFSAPFRFQTRNTPDGAATRRR